SLRTIDSKGRSSPCDPSATLSGVEITHHLSASSSGTTTTPTPNGGSLFSGIASSNKRPRPDDWLSSPSPGSAGPLPPLTPSPGPPGHSYTVISSPMSSGSYDPYSPNGKIGLQKLPSILNSHRLSRP
ncbi:hypothetical protein L9F63_017457, partial [Diploptera punctata]